MTQLALFLPAAALLAISPGANNFLAMHHGMRCGVREAALALTGRLIAFTIMLALAVVGLAAVLTRSQLAFEVIKWAGVAYLTYLGVRSFRARPGTESDDVASSAQTDRRERGASSTVAANPKALLLFTAFLPQFVDPTKPVGAQLLILGPLYIAVEMGAALAWALLGHRLHRANLRRRAQRRLDQAVGCVFIGLAGTLATAER